VTIRSTIKRSEYVQQTAFAGPRFTHNRQHLSLPHPEGQILKEHKVGCTRPINLLQAVSTKYLRALIYWMHAPSSTVQLRPICCILKAVLGSNPPRSIQHQLGLLYSVTSAVSAVKICCEKYRFW